MIEKLKEIEKMSIDELLEFKQAVLAYDLGFSSDTITLEQINAVEKTIEWYYNDDDAEFISSETFDMFNSIIED